MHATHVLFKLKQVYLLRDPKFIAVPSGTVDFARPLLGGFAGGVGFYENDLEARLLSLHWDRGYGCVLIDIVTGRRVEPFVVPPQRPTVELRPVD